MSSPLLPNATPVEKSTLTILLGWLVKDMARGASSEAGEASIVSNLPTMTLCFSRRQRPVAPAKRPRHLQTHSVRAFTRVMPHGLGWANQAIPAFDAAFSVSPSPRTFFLFPGLTQGLPQDSSGHPASCNSSSITHQGYERGHDLLTFSCSDSALRVSSASLRIFSASSSCLRSLILTALAFWAVGAKRKKSRRLE